MNVSYVMSKNPSYVRPDVSVQDAHAFMKKENVKRLPVLDKKNKLVGIITERDLLNASPSAATTLDMYEVSYLLSKLTVEKIMQKKVVTVNDDVAIEEAAKIMVDNNVSALPVMRDNSLVGIVSDGDLYRLFINLFGAHQEGVRITVLLPERTGELKNISDIIASIGGNIIALVTSDGKDPTTRMCIIKVDGVDEKKLVDALKPNVIEIIDVR